MKVYDVIQVGYGPVSESLALMLGRQGRQVAVCERWTTRYPLPRAVSIDHEIYRILHANGMGAALPAVSHAGSIYQWFNADWKELISFDWSQPSISGGPGVYFVHQPTLEAALDGIVRAQPGVELHLGWEAQSIDQDDEFAYVTLRNPETGDEKRLAARYVIGCDGANSLVRAAIGGEREDRGFEADWLVIDVLLRDGVTIEQLGIPASGQYCNPERPTTIVPAGVRDGRLFRRWEFMRLPGESIEDLEREETVWSLLKPWANDTQVELVRHKVYSFRSLIASRWRDRRLLIAGDAAHVMPPFMGQGLCSGMRDAWNLAWKLGFILDGTAEDRLLDSYQVERQPHVGQITEMAIYLGKIICIPDKDVAAARDAAFFSGAAPPPPPFPQLIAGLLHRDGDALSPGAGLLSPHVTLRGSGGDRRLDDFKGGGGFVVVARGFDPEALLDETTRAALERLGTRFVSLAAAGEESMALQVDLDGRLEAMFDEQGWDAMIVRPDFYLYGGASSPAEFGSLTADLIADLAAAGVHTGANALAAT